MDVLPALLAHELDALLHVWSVHVGPVVYFELGLGCLLKGALLEVAVKLSHIAVTVEGVTVALFKHLLYGSKGLGVGHGADDGAAVTGLAIEGAFTCYIEFLPFRVEDAAGHLVVGWVALEVLLFLELFVALHDFYCFSALGAFELRIVHRKTTLTIFAIELKVFEGRVF